MSDKYLKGANLRYKCDQSMGDFFFHNAERFSDRICQVDATLGKTETYSSLKTRSVRAALELQKRGVTSKDVVVLCTKVTLDNLVPIVASFFLGAKVANLDPSLSERQTSHLLSLVTPKIIFVEEASLTLIENSLRSVKLTGEIVVFGYSSKYSSFSDFVKPQINADKFNPTKVDIHDTSIIFFSSGTTGLPKAICHSHCSFLNVAHSLHEAGSKRNSLLSFTSFYWVSASITLTTSFISGGHRIFCSTTEPEHIFKTIEEYKVTTLFLAPILSYKLTNFERYKQYDMSSLHTILIGGTPISTNQLQRIKDVFENTNVIFAYGCTECGVLTIFDPEIDKTLMSTKLGSCGKAAPGVVLKVVDFTTGEILGPNQKGEICAKSPTLMTGYYNADSTSAFDGDGFLKTGDIGYYDQDGCFYVIERLKEMFKYMSWHVVPSAIEAVLLEHPGIKEAVVFGVPKSEEEGEVPTACIVLKDGFCVDKEEIEKFIEERVSDYEKLRGGVIFVESLQKTPSGKLMRREIRSKYLGTT